MLIHPLINVNLLVVMEDMETLQQTNVYKHAQ